MTPQEFEKIAVWMGWEKNKQFTDCGDWVDQNRLIRGYANCKTSLTDAECIEALNRLVEKGYEPGLVHNTADRNWYCAIWGQGASSPMVQRFVPTINQAVEQALLKLIEAAGEAK